MQKFVKACRYLPFTGQFTGPNLSTRWKSGHDGTIGYLPRSCLPSPVV
ncbi:MAG: hypothetical protein ACXVBK_16345 [Flavisolibacter sp.]